MKLANIAVTVYSICVTIHSLIATDNQSTTPSRPTAIRITERVKTLEYSNQKYLTRHAN